MGKIQAGSRKTEGPTRKKAYIGGVGWVERKHSQDANYENIGEGWAFLISFARWFPDFLQDLFRSEEADYDLSLLQRVFMRAMARHQYCDITACRGATKTYCTLNENMDEMLLWTGIKEGYIPPTYKQGAKIGSATYSQIQKDYPELAAHFNILADSSDRFEIGTSFGSNLSISAFRGNNLHKVVAEEYAQEGANGFDEDRWKQVVLPSVRLEYRVNGERDSTYIRFKQHSITSAGRRQNHSYETRCRHYRMMSRGESAFVVDVPYDAILLCQMRPVEWVETMRPSLTPDEWAREMESRYTGADENPVISDSTLSDARILTMPEEHHCCKDRGNNISPDEVIYVIGYDVSYEDNAKNAKCACTVCKCTKQAEWFKKDRYLKQYVWIDDWQPSDAKVQARKLKQIWYRYCFDDKYAYIAIDAWQYGRAVLEALMSDLGDGLPPLCCYNHSQYTEFELAGAIPCIYPIKAGGVGTTDPDSEMIRYAEIQFENRNVQLLMPNYEDGVAAYKKTHRIKDDKYDFAIFNSYKKTTELVGQIQNLKKITNSSGVAEKRISKHIQRDTWSSLKYSLRFAQMLERENLMKNKKTSDWDAIIKEYKKGNHSAPARRAGNRRLIGRRGGKLF